MSKCLNNDNKVKMRRNIKRHRLKLLQYLENTNDTVLKPKIKLISNDLEKSKSNYNANTKPASSTEVQTIKLEPTVRVDNIKTTSSIEQQNKFLKNSEVITPEHGLNIEIKYVPIPTVEIKDYEPTSTLKDQLIEELNYSSSSDEFNDDIISVGNNEDWNESCQPDIIVDKCNKRDSITIDTIKHYDGKSKEGYLYYSLDSDIPVSELNLCTTTIKRKQTRKIVILANPSSNVVSCRKMIKKPLDRSIHNAKERACRGHIAKLFNILRNVCSYFDTKRRMPSKQSILMAAKKECELLRHFYKRITIEKKLLQNENKDLKERLAVLTHKS